MLGDYHNASHAGMDVMWRGERIEVEETRGAM